MSKRREETVKKFWICLFLLGFMVVSNTTVFAADVKFSGEFYLQGWYNKNHSLIAKDSPVGPGNRGASAFYTERLRMGIDFQVAKGLTLVTRFDALERKWMAARTSISAVPSKASTDSEAENIAWDIANVRFVTPIGMFMVGNKSSDYFGTPYTNNGDESKSAYLIWAMPIGPWTFALRCLSGKPA